MLDVSTQCTCMTRITRAPFTEQKAWEIELVSGLQVDSEAEVNQAWVTATHTQIYPELASLLWVNSRSRIYISRSTLKLSLNRIRNVLSTGWWIQKKRRTAVVGFLKGVGNIIITIGLLWVKQAPQDGPKTTLIVSSNNNLAEKWEEDIRKCFERSLWMSVLLHKGTKQAQEISDFNRRDAVITTYGMLASAFPKIKKKSLMSRKQWTQRRHEGGQLLQNQWFRVVLDDAHIIRNEQTDKWKAEFCLKAHSPWYLSGTPIYTDVSELYSVFKLLKYNVPYFGNPEFDERTRKCFQKYLHSILLRRPNEEVWIDLPLWNQE